MKEYNSIAGFIIKPEETSKENIQQTLDRQIKQITQFELDQDFYVGEIEDLSSIIEKLSLERWFLVILLVVSLLTNPRFINLFV